jgi:uncharacterized protein YdiU (UPF0061 family)
MAFKIEEYGLEGKVKELASTMTLYDIKDTLNSKYVPEGAEILSHMSIKRYCDARGIEYVDKRKSNAVVGRLVNTLEEAHDCNDKLDSSINLMEKHMEDYKKQLMGLTLTEGMTKQDIIKLVRENVDIKKEIRECIVLQEKLIGRKTSNLDRITNYQSTLLKQENFRKLVVAMVEAMEESDKEAKAKFISRIKEDFELWDCFRSLMGN